MIDFSKLDPEFSKRAQALLDLLEKDFKIKMLPYFGIRTLLEQGKLWRQSRPKQAIDYKVQYLNQQNAGYLAAAIENAGPSTGKVATQAIPGYSWHNWGRALDCVYMKNNLVCWDAKDPGYRVYASQAEKMGLTAGLDFKSFTDAGHIQLNSKEVPQLYTLEEVNEEMGKRFTINKQ